MYTFCVLGGLETWRLGVLSKTSGRWTWINGTVGKIQMKQFCETSVNVSV